MNKNQTIQTHLLSTKEAAKYIGMSASFLHQLRIYGAKPGQQPIPFIKLGKKTVKYRINDLDEWLNSRGSYTTTAQVKAEELRHAQQ